MEFVNAYLTFGLDDRQSLLALLTFARFDWRSAHVFFTFGVVQLQSLLTLLTFGLIDWHLLILF